MLKKKIKLLMDLIKDSEINQIEVSSFWGAQKIKLIKNPTSSSLTEVPNKNTIIPVKENEMPLDSKTTNLRDQNEEIDTKTYEQQDKTATFNAPLVGTFYLSPNPESDPFVKVGDKVKVGETICIIEAMKIFNEIKVEDSSNSGEIVEILVDDNTPIEYNQPLFKIKSD